MKPSRAQKYLNKLKGWAKHEGMVVIEIPEAMAEFVPNPGRVPEESQDSVGKLFEDWFAWERRMTRTNLTMLELFIRSQGRKLKAKDVEIYRRFAAEASFGLFRLKRCRARTDA